MKQKKLVIGLAVLALMGLLFLGREWLLEGMGAWLAPTGDPLGDAVVVEGTQAISTGIVNQGIVLLREGKVKRLYLVLHRFSGDRALFGLQEVYGGFLERELERLGIPSRRYRVLSAPIDDHPITLAEARFVVPFLYRDGVRRAVLVSQGFHTRRSWQVYQRLGNSLGIRFTPYPFFTGYPRARWWRSLEGIKEFVSEGVKWGWYWGKGYL